MTQSEREELSREIIQQLIDEGFVEDEDNEAWEIVDKTIRDWNANGE